MHKKRKGSIAELAVATRLMKEGWNVLVPYGENTRYDLVAERGDRFLRIQVKYSTPKDGRLYVNCRSSNNWSILPYTAKEIDVIAIYNVRDESISFVPVAKMRKSAMYLRLDPTKTNQRLRVRFAKECYELHDNKGSYQTLVESLGAGA